MKKTQTQKQSSLSPSSPVCLPPALPPPALSFPPPSCPVMCSGQTVWLLGVSGMIIETEASKDIPRCLAYPENEPGPFRLWLFADSTFRDSGLTRRLQCPYRVFLYSLLWVDSFFFFFFNSAISEWILVMWSFCFRFPF